MASWPSPRRPFLHRNRTSATSWEDYQGALREYEEAVRLAPKNAFYRIELGWTRQYLGDLDGAIADYKESMQQNPEHRNSKLNFDRTTRMKQLLPVLPDVIAGKTELKNSEDTFALALCCAMPFQNRYAASVRLYEKALQADPKLAEDPDYQHRWFAACYAGRAARGDGIDSPKEPAERA